MDFNFPKTEEGILKFWKDNKIFEKSIEQRRKAPNFVFFEGPPTANAKPGIHHVLSRVFKDIICRYKTMQGFKVLRKAGWDTHGLPVELEIEKKLGLKNKKDIEKFGIAKFNKLCRESVWNYKKDWEKLTERIAFWLDMENPYITYTPDYIETVWWLIKQIYQKDLVYKDYKVVPYCPRCGTSLSSHEVAQGYKKVKENSVYVKFSLKKEKNTYFLVWTTTPWTLPGNVAIALNPNFVYAKAKVGGEILILAKERLNVLCRDYEIIEEIKGKDLLDEAYEPLFKLSQPNKKACVIIPGNFVSLEEGTGLVHIAPAFGEEDMEVIKTQNQKLRTQNSAEFPVLMTVDEEGKMKTPDYPWHNLFVKDADPLIVEALNKRNLLFKEELYEHDYPFCWRCRSPLLYYAKESWFINMQRVKKDLIANNQKINWVPAHLKQGRFGEWLKDIKDWAFSRERYWGTPLPVWQCKKCGKLKVIGGKRDLIEQNFSTNKYFILRHGETIHQTKKKGQIYKWPDIPPVKLTKKGEKEIKRIAGKIKKEKIDLIYASDIFRTKQTAEIVAEEIGLKVNLDKRLRDINLGKYHGRSKKEFYRDFPDVIKRFYDAPEGGETWNEAINRVVNFIKDIDKKHKNENILIISHGDPLWLLDGVMKGLNNEEMLKQLFKEGYIKVGEFRRIEFKNLPYNKKMELDLHRPYIDEVRFYCSKCENLMERTPEVVDCWLDSGSMPFAQGHWPFSQNSKRKTQKLAPPELFPADYISEAIDQTRGWFYTLLAISTLLGFGAPYKNVISLGHVLDEKGEKMSKSKGNTIDPWYIIDKYGADAARWYFYTINQPGDPKLFAEKDIEGCLKRFILTLWNSFLFFNTYVKSKKSLQYYKTFRKLGLVKLNNLDRWIVSKLHSLIREVSDNLEKYDVASAARDIESFVIEDLSNWYIRRSRRRFQKPESKKEFDDASRTLGYVLFEISLLSAPFIPFLSEQIHKELVVGQSVHLNDWPEDNKKLIDSKLEKKMETIREIVAQALAERAKLGIKVRQPLQALQIKNYELQKEKELLGLIKDEVNVKKITFGKSLKLDAKITDELKEEGIIREIIRNIQEMRKKAGLKPKDKILAIYLATPELSGVLEKSKKFLLKEAKIKDLITAEKSRAFKEEKEAKVDGQRLSLMIKKVK